MVNAKQVSLVTPLLDSFRKAMSSRKPDYISMPLNQYRLVGFLVQNGLDTNISLFYDIMTMSSERGSTESFTDYKTRLKMQQLFKKYRWMVLTNVDIMI